MKTKKVLIISHILLTAVLLTIAPLTEPGMGIFAQGIYSRHVEASENEGKSKENNQGNDGGVYRAGGTEGEDGGGLPSKISPMKDAWSIVVIAGIGYGLCIARRRNDR